MQKHPVLLTQRLILHPFSLENAAEVQRLANVKQIVDTTISIRYPYSLQEIQRRIQAYSKNFNQKKSVHFAISCQNNQQLMGVIELREIEAEHLNAELSFWIGTEFWGKGIATEAGRCILDYGFNQLQLNRVYADHMLRNSASGKVMQKLRMKQEGILQQRVIGTPDVKSDAFLQKLLMGETPKTALLRCDDRLPR